MQKQTVTITVLSLTAVILLLATYLTAPPAVAATVIKDRQFQACTATTQQGSDGVYVLDNQTGILTFFAYDPTTRRVVPRATQQVADLFPAPQGNGAPPPQPQY
ncbi:MAG TPA: hypothetical protein VG722_12835 [Tepidisphaeraceae bacterium]|nr:hypothetical protein [Tepidisphaeraceae bacterium]